MAHVLSVDLVKHNRGDSRDRGDLDRVQAGLAERQVGTEEFLGGAPQGTRKQTMSDGRYGR